MSQRTIVEFNHDLWYRIEEDKAGFAEAVLAMLRGGDGPREVEGLKPYGITHVGQRHHSDKAEVVFRHSKVVL